MKRALFVSFLLTQTLFMVAQRNIGSLENNLDQSMVPGMANDSTNEKPKDFEPPVDVRSWTIDDTYGNVTPIVVDTLMHLFQNKALGEGLYGHYNT